MPRNALYIFISFALAATIQLGVSLTSDFSARVRRDRYPSMGMPQMQNMPAGFSPGESMHEMPGQMQKKPTEQKTVAKAKLTGCTPRTYSAPSYTGPLFDAHLHMPALFDFTSMMMDHAHENVSMGSGTDPVLDKDIALSDILCLLKKENSRGAIGFSMGVVQMKDTMLAKAREIREKSKGAIRLFIMIPGYPSADIDTMLTAEKGLFEGIGEVALYFMDLKGVRPDHQRFIDVYTVAQKHNAIVMIHPDSMQEQAVETVVRAYPNVRFLFHGPELENAVHGLIAKYPNVYYSIDTSLIRMPGFPGGLMYMARDKADFKAKYTQNYDQIMNHAVSTWKSRIEAYPDRYVWGTDRAYDWMFDEQVSELIDKFSREFIGKLDPATQEKFAYKSAEKLLGK